MQSHGLRPSLTALIALALLRATCDAAEPPVQVPQFIAAAVADPARPPIDRARDAGHHPAETLAFAGVRPGETVLELNPRTGYYTRMLSAAVGAEGHVYAVVPQNLGVTPIPDVVNTTKIMNALAASPRYRNVTVSRQPLGALAAPAPVDLIFTFQNYHDFRLLANENVTDIDKALFRALKPGGTLVIVDHAAVAGSATRDTQALHRIDPETVRKDLLAAGFQPDGESTLLRNPADSHEVRSTDLPVRGHTDRFLLRFRKPG